MKKSVKVKMITDTSTMKKGDIRNLNPERAEAWVKAGWAEYLKMSKPKHGFSINSQEEK